MGLGDQAVAPTTLLLYNGSLFCGFIVSTKILITHTIVPLRIQETHQDSGHKTAYFLSLVFQTNIIYTHARQNCKEDKGKPDNWLVSKRRQVSPEVS